MQYLFNFNKPMVLQETSTCRASTNQNYLYSIFSYSTAVCLIAALLRERSGALFVPILIGVLVEQQFYSKTFSCVLYH